MATLSPIGAQDQLEHIHDDRVPEMLASQIICFIVALVAVVVRLLSRKLGRVPIKADDFTIFAALTFVTGYLIVGMLAVHAGAGRHAILLKDPVKYLKLVFAISILYLLAIAAVKISILLFYRRIFKVDRIFSILSWSLGVFISAYTVAGIFVVIFQCSPVHAFWDFEIPKACIRFTPPAVVLAALNVATDFLTLALPMPLIWKLHVSRQRKILLAGVFLLGSFVCIGSIYRAKIVHKMISLDASWSDVDPAIWAMVEISLGIVSACLPCLQPLFTSIAQQGKNSKVSEESGESGVSQRKALRGDKVEVWTG